MDKLPSREEIWIKDTIKKDSWTVTMPANNSKLASSQIPWTEKLKWEEWLTNPKIFLYKCMSNKLTSK